MDPRSMDPLCGPGPWTGSIKIWSGSMDPIFLLALKIAVIKDYECVPRLWYNLNSCLLLKSLYLRTAKIKIYRQKVCHSQKLELSEESLQMGSPNLFYSHVYFWQFLIFLLHYYHFFCGLFYILALASWGLEVASINYDLMTFDDTLRDGSSFDNPCTSLMAHLLSKFMLNSGHFY